MKKILFAALVVLLALTYAASFADAQFLRCNSSGIKTGNASFSSSYKALCGVLIITDGTHNGSITIYDHPSAASGNVLFRATVPGAAYFGGATFENYVHAKRGITAVPSGTGMSYIIYYLE